MPCRLRFLVTGAGGNLGRKLVAALAAAPWCARVVALDLAARPDALPGTGAEKVQVVAGDLTDATGGWTESFAGVGACIHFAAQNPDVNATWSEAARSFDMDCPTSAWWPFGMGCGGSSSRPRTT